MGRAKGTGGKRHPLVLTSAMAATLSSLGACSSQDDEWERNLVADRDTAVCVDTYGNRIEDDYCGGGRYYIAGSSTRWKYINRNSPLPYLGDSVTDGRNGFVVSDTPRPGASYARAPAYANLTRTAVMSRGGFGSSGRSFGGGRS